MTRNILFALFFTLSSLAYAVNDSLNIVDQNNLKQGHWIYTNKVKNLPGYRHDQVVEEGDFKDDKKTGKWVFYYNNDKIKHVLTFNNNMPNGYAVFYYKNGNKREEGIWKNNKWVGDYKYYYENGNLRSEWKYNQQGLRDGVQKYYHENGNLMIEGTWAGGKEAGVIKEFYEDGSIKSERVFNNGKMDATASKTYKKKEEPVVAKEEPKKPVVKDAESVPEEKERVIVKAEEEKEVARPFDGNGYHVLRNKDGKVTRKGEFENGFLVDGEVYQYDGNGELFKTTRYKEGRVVQIVNHQEDDKQKKK